MILPKFYPNDKVLAYNYRTGNFEPGTVIGVETRWSADRTGSHKYRVQLERKSENDNTIFLHLDPSGIKRNLNQLKPTT